MKPYLHCKRYTVKPLQFSFPRIARTLAGCDSARPEEGTMPGGVRA